MKTTAAVTYTKDPDVVYDEDVVIKIEQPFSDTQLDLGDVQTMLTMALSGVSATTYNSAGTSVQLYANGDALVTLVLYVYVNKADLIPELIPSTGTLTHIDDVVVTKEFTKIFERDNSVDLGYRFISHDTDWMSKAITSFGLVLVPQPDLTIQGTTFKTTRDIFGVIRTKLKVPALVYSLVFTAKKSEGYAIPDSISITSKWSSDGSTYSSAEDISVPQYVADALDTCESTGELVKGDSLVIVGGEDISEPKPTPTVTIAYDTCTGKKLGTKTVG